MKAVAYIRVSTSGQATEGVSLESQRVKFEAWVTANDYECGGIHVDAGVSGGKTQNRPALQAALNEACEAGAVLVVYSLSRLARSTRDVLTIAERLDKAGADLVSLTEKIDTTSAAGKMLFRVLAVLAEFERDLVSERTTAAMSHLRAQGRRISRHVPFGFNLSDDGKMLIEDELEQAAIRYIHELRAEGLSLRKIGEALERNCIKTKNGGKWQAQTISDILKRVA